MSLVPNQKGFLHTAIAVAMTVSAVQMVHAGAKSSPNEVEQLRAEVAELRALIQQQAAQREAPPPPPAVVVAAPAPVHFDPKELKLTTAKGAEVKLYGFVRGDATYTVEGNDSDFGKVAASTGAAKDKLRATAQTTRIGLDFSSPVGEGNKVGGKIEADFAGGTDNTNNIRLRHAYLTYNNWLFGQTMSTFLSNHAPEMIDFSTNVGGGTTRLPMVRYGYDLAPATKVFVSLEEGDSTVTSGNTIKYKLPVLAAKVTQSFADNKVQASLRGLVEQYDVNAGTGSNGQDETAWGVAIGANFQVAPQLKLIGDYSHVKGNNKYLYGSNAAATVVNNQVAQNEYNAVQAGATWQINPKLRSTLAYGALFADKDTAYARSFAASGSTSENANKEVRHAWINFVYSPAKPIELALEYVDGERETFAGQKFNDNRFGLMAKYSF
jgi:hypothetical protein